MLAKPSFTSLQRAAGFLGAGANIVTQTMTQSLTAAANLHAHAISSTALGFATVIMLGPSTVR